MMLMNIKQSKLYVGLSHIYRGTLKALEPITVPVQASSYHKLQKKEILRLRNKKPLVCVFMVVDDSIWKCDALYRAMESSAEFDPLIVATAVPNGTGYTDMVEKMDQVYNVFEKKGYKVIKSYDSESGKHMDIRKLNPDIVVYTKPFKSLINSNYYVDSLKDKLTVYIPYYINGTNDYDLAYNLPVHNLCWRYYVESPFHLGLAKKYSHVKGKNVVVSGYPGIEDFINPEYKPVDTWKISDRKIKRIVWAPHQSIDISGTVNYSTFLKYAEFMLEMAEKYRDKVQFAFKPHPLLKKRLIEKWGKEKAESYYNAWATMPNSMISDSDYHDLFLTSDALIHDCGSFTIEYLYLNKPLMRLMNGIDPTTMFGEFGMACINQHYLAYEKEEIETFIKNVIDGVDDKYEERTRFVKDSLGLTGKLPSEVIIEDILQSIRR